MLCDEVLTIGATLKNVQQTTETEIVIPARPEARGIEQDDAITVRGASQAAITNAMAKIRDIVRQNERRIAPDHFVMLPLNDACFVNTVNNIKRAMLDSDKELDESMFMPSISLHITVCMLTLTTSKRRARGMC